jgi:hypothetical protein
MFITRSSLARAAATAGILPLILGAAACGTPSASRPLAPPLIDVHVEGHSIQAPATLRPGVTTFRYITHARSGVGSLQIARLDPGVTYAQVGRELQRGNLSDVFRLVAGQGGVSHTGKAAGSSWTTRLRAGNYLLVDDETQAVVPLRVRGRTRAAAAPPVTAVARFTTHGLRIPRGLDAGTWQVVNGDRIAHELALIKIHGGHTEREALAALDGRPPAWLTPEATLNNVGPGQSAWYRLHDLHGDYLLVDYLPMFQGAAQGPIGVFHHFR